MTQLTLLLSVSNIIELVNSLINLILFIQYIEMNNELELLHAIQERIRAGANVNTTEALTLAQLLELLEQSDGVRYLESLNI
jgi:hypothetical protein